MELRKRNDWLEISNLIEIGCLCWQDEKNHITNNSRKPSSVMKKNNKIQFTPDEESSSDSLHTCLPR